jgi:hypothetical protein
MVLIKNTNNFNSEHLCPDGGEINVRILAALLFVQWEVGLFHRG